MTTDDSAASPADRREKIILREVVDDFIAHVREVSGRGGEMSPEEIQHAQQRMQWLADEVWRLALEGGDTDL